MFCGDGCLMEGAGGGVAGRTSEAPAVLTVLYDTTTRSSTTGRPACPSTDDIPPVRRLRLAVTRSTGTTIAAIDAALTGGAGQSERPTPIAMKTIIGYSAPKNNNVRAHSAARAEVAAAKAAIGWTAAPFEIPAVAEGGAPSATAAPRRRLPHRPRGAGGRAGGGAGGVRAPGFAATRPKGSTRWSRRPRRPLFDKAAEGRDPQRQPDMALGRS